MTSRTTALAVLAAVTVAVATPALASTVPVRVGSFYYEDASAGDGRIVVNQGDQITFTFQGPTGHTATVSGMFASGVRSGNETYTTPALTQVGTFTLYCEVHGASQHSTRLVITDPASPVPSPSPSVKPSPKPSPKRSPRPSPRPSPKPSPQPSPTRASPAPSPSPTRAASPSPSPTPTPSPSSSPSPSPSRTPSPTNSPRSAAAAVTASPSPSPSPASTFGALPAVSIDDSAPSWLLPGGVLLLMLLLGAGAIAAGRRRQL